MPGSTLGLSVYVEDDVFSCSSENAAIVANRIALNTHGGCRDAVLVPLFHAVLTHDPEAGGDVISNVIVNVCDLPRSVPHIMSLLCLAGVAPAPNTGAAVNHLDGLPSFAFVNVAAMLCWSVIVFMRRRM